MLNSPHQLSLILGLASDKGIKDQNEDFLSYFIPGDTHQLEYKGIALAIADGMSGSDDGKLASQSCINSFINDYYSTPDSWSVLTAGEKILSALNAWLYSQGHTRYHSEQGLVSTLSIIIFKSTTAHVFHVGDSRIYRLRKGNLEQLTRDHRIWLNKEKSYLNRAMGIEPKLEVDYKAVPIEIGDAFLLVTDGIHDFVDDKDLKNLLASGQNLTDTANNIVERAINNNSDDNLTCLLAEVTGLPPAKEDEILRRHSNLPFPPPLSAGMILDGYKIEEELHASKRTQIYKAHDTQTGQTVILKTPSVLFDDDKLYIEHFLQEEWAGKRINNAHVVKVLESNRKKTCIYYVTEYLEGGTLRDWIKNHPKPYIREIRQIVEQIAKGLRALHRLEMLHQDLKPENIMFDKYGTVKIIDFGSVKISGINEITPIDRAFDENILGTLNYTAPEYHLGQRGNVKSDIFSLAVITYEMINGALPYGQMPEKPDKEKLAKLAYRPSFHFNPMVPQWIDGALKKGVALNPQARYGHLSEFIYDLTNPNPDFLTETQKLPLIQRNPLLFWKSLAIFLLISNLFWLYLLLRQTS